MIGRALTLAALTCCALVALSFALFAVDQAAGASQRQVAAITDASSEAGAVPQSQREPQPRRFIDAAAHTLLSPFAGLLPSDSVWVQRGAATLIALMVYGLGLGYLARFFRGRS